MDVGDKQTLDLLELRVKTLEDKIIGSLPKDDIYPEAVTTLAGLGSQLGNALSTRDRMMMVMKRLEELERYLDPSYGELTELSDNMKLDLVLAHEEQLRNQHQHLNTVISMKHVLDSAHITDAARLTDDLVQLSHKHGELETLAAEQTPRISNMLDQYNLIITTLTESFVKMDEVVTNAEIVAIPKKIDE